MKKIIIAILLIVVIFVVAVVVYLQFQKPVYSGKLKLKGLHEKVDVYFDSYGVPHIYAQNAHDAYMAFGYLQMQDRYFQMEMMRRVANGRLSELLGKELVPTDKFFRSLGLKQAVERTMKTSYQQNDSMRKVMDAYVEGVNQYIQHGKTPIEFTILNIPKEKFSLSDIEMIVGYMAYTFQPAFKTDPLMTKLRARLGDKYIKDLGLDYIPCTQKIPVWTANDTMFSFVHQVNTILKNLPTPLLVGSNSWVLSPSKTKSGRVMFSNDTHIAYSQPSVWYDAHIEYPGFSLYGQFLAGVPFALLGHSRSTAWGLTMFLNDDLDMFREKRNSKNPNQVWFKDHWENLKTQHEVIKVKNESDIHFDIKYSRHGSLMNESLATLDSTETNPIAVWWEYVQFPSHDMEALYNINHSHTIKDIEKGAALIHAPGLNIMAGDSNGNIGWWASAKLFKRPAQQSGKFILDGASGKDEITEYLDFSYNPHSVNPPGGFVFSANNQPDSVKGFFYQGYYEPHNRAYLINQFLNNNKKWDMPAFHKMVTSCKSDLQPQSAKVILSCINKKSLQPNEAKAYDILQNWQGDFQLNSIAPTIFYKIIYLTFKNAFEDEMGELDFKDYIETNLFERAFPNLLKNDSSLWWDNVKTPAKETRTQIINESYKQAIAALEKQLGTNVDKWNWGKVHILEHVHPIGSKKPFDKIFNVGPFPSIGGKEVLNNVSFDINGDGIYKATFGPAIRNQLDFADIEAAESVLPTGESGNVMSKHYADEAKLYNEGKFRPQLMNKTQIIKTCEGHLILTK
jgi:penicillin amidase